MRLWITIIFIVGLACSAFAAEITGRVLEADTNKPLTGANVSVQGTDWGASTNASGKFVLSNLPEGTYKVKIAYMGYETETRTVELKDNDKNLTIALSPRAVPMGEVKVTSTRQTLKLKQVPIPVSVVEQDAIQKTMPVTSTEVLQQEPGLSLGHDGAWGTFLSIRGLSKNNIVVLIDGNRVDTATDLAASFSMVDVNDIERIEVIKGAGSSLYGTGAIGGVVNIITRDGWYSESLYATSTLSTHYSSVNDRRDASVTAYTGGKRWYFKLSGTLRDAEEVETPHGTLGNSQFRDNSLSARAGIKLTQNHEFKFNAQRYRAFNVGIPGANNLFPSKADVRYPTEERDLYSIEYIGRNIIAPLPRLSVKYFKQDILRDVENIPHIIKSMPTTPPKEIHMQEILPKATHATQGVQLQTDWSLPANQYVILGIDTWQKELDSRRKKHMRIDVLDPDNGSVVKSIDQTLAERPLPLSTYYSTGVYAQDEVPLLQDRIKLTLGGRWDWIWVENDKTLNPVYIVQNGQRIDSPPTQTVLWKENTVNNHSWSGNLGLLFHATPSTDFTFTAARSFRSPYISERYQYIDLGNLVKVGNPNLKPENGMFTDVGIRVWKDKISFSANAFYNRITDMVIEKASTYEGRNALLKSNVGKAELYGGEVRTDYRFYKQYSLHLSTSYVHGQDVYVDEPLPLIPPLNGRISLSGPVSPFLNFNIAATLYSEQERVAAWEASTPAYAYVDVYAFTRSFQIMNLRSQLFFGVENVLDTAYRNHLASNRGEISIEPGRNFMIRWELGI